MYHKLYKHSIYVNHLYTQQRPLTRSLSETVCRQTSRPSPQTHKIHQPKCMYRDLHAALRTRVCDTCPHLRAHNVLTHGKDFPAPAKIKWVQPSHPHRIRWGSFDSLCLWSPRWERRRGEIIWVLAAHELEIVSSYVTSPGDHFEYAPWMRMFK